MIKNENIKKLVSNYHENKLSHAFLFATNELQLCNTDIVELIKQINCPHEYNQNCQRCNLCYQIANQTISDIIKIEPDGMVIKKSQVQEIKSNFSTTPLVLKHKFYIINQAEKLNLFSANTLLKFLEEPENDIYAFLITNNKEKVIDTIRSRCQIINANYYNISIWDKSAYDTNKDKIINFLSEYLNEIFFLKNDGIITNRHFKNIYNFDRQFLLDCFSFLFYSIFDRINGSIFEIKPLEKLNLKNLNLLSDCCLELINSLNFNSNSDLALDNFVMKVSVNCE